MFCIGMMWIEALVGITILLNLARKCNVSISSLHRRVSTVRSRVTNSWGGGFGIVRGLEIS